MLKTGNFLTLQEGDSVHMSLALKSITEIVKHFIEARNRSYLCKGPDCDLCRQGLRQRYRYQAKIIIDGENLTWEFGEDIYKDIAKQPATAGFVNLKVTRLGLGTRTQYQIRSYEPGEEEYDEQGKKSCKVCGKFRYRRGYHPDYIRQCTCPEYTNLRQIPV